MHQPPSPPAEHEIRLLVEEGAVVRLPGTVDVEQWHQQAMMGLGCSMLLGSRPVLLQDWLPGLDVLCHGIALPADAQTSFDGQDEWHELHARIRWWLALPSNTAPRVYSLSTRLGVLRMHPRSEAKLQPDHAMRLVCDWGMFSARALPERPPSR